MVQYSSFITFFCRPTQEFKVSHILPPFQNKGMFWKTCGLKVIFRTFRMKLRALHSSHEALFGEPEVSIVKLKLLALISLEARHLGGWHRSI